MRSSVVAALSFALAGCVAAPDDSGPPPTQCVEVPPLIDFGEVTSNSKFERVLRLINLSVRPVDVTIEPVAAPFSIAFDGRLTLTPGLTIPLRVGFEPPDGRQQFGQLFITGGYGCERKEIELVGRGPGRLLATVNELDFGAVDPGATVTLPLTLINTRREPLLIFVDGILSISAPSGFEVPAGGAAEVPLTFAPRFGDQPTQVLVVQGMTKDADGGVRRIVDTVFINVRARVGVPVLTFDRTSFELEHLPTSSGELTRTLTVRNSGTGASEVTVESNDAGVSVSMLRQLELPPLVPAGGAASITLHFLADRPGLTQGTLVLRTDDPTQEQVPITISAMGEDVIPCPGQLDVSPRDLVWQPAAYPAQVTFTFTNPFGVDCLVDDVNAEDWALLEPQRDQLVVPALSSATRTVVIPGPGAKLLRWKTFMVGPATVQSTSMLVGL